MKNTHDLDLEKFEELRDDVLGEILGGQSADIADNLKMLRVTAGRVPDVDTLIRISDTFNISVDDLIR